MQHVVIHGNLAMLDYILGRYALYIPHSFCITTANHHGF